MKHLTIIFSVFTVLTANSVAAPVNDWPKLDKRDDSVACTDALKIAKVAFHSDVSYLYAPPVIPASAGSTLVLGPEKLDISSGDDLIVTAPAFIKIKKGEDRESRNIYWQAQATDGIRLVIDQTNMSWQGDIYSLFAIKESMTPIGLMAKFREKNESPDFAAIIDSSWRPPLVFQEKRSGHTWFIDVGHPAKFLHDWQVYSRTVKGMELICTVRFRPEVSNSINLMPSPVRALARLLDQTIGPGTGEGTLHPTVRIRVGVEHSWANAALRPWSLDTPYNTRDEIDAALLAWSRKGASYRHVYKKIQRQYPLAQRSLTDYYRRNFHRANEDARLMAAFALDNAFRSHYVFHSEDENRDFRRNSPQPNPWRSKGQSN